VMWIVLASLGLEEFRIVLQMQGRDPLKKIRRDIYLLMRLQI
jgi:hypothetical protein